MYSRFVSKPVHHIVCNIMCAINFKNYSRLFQFGHLITTSSTSNLYFDG